jgi:hypothetical protein
MLFGNHCAGDRMLRMQKYFCDFALFHNVAALNHGNLIANGADDLHFMRDQDDGQSKLAVDIQQ